MNMYTKFMEIPMSDNPSLEEFKCEYCGEVKPQYLFSKKRPGHRKWICKLCLTKRAKVWREKSNGRPLGNDWKKQTKTSRAFRPLNFKKGAE